MKEMLLFTVSVDPEERGQAKKHCILPLPALSKDA